MAPLFLLIIEYYLVLIKPVIFILYKCQLCKRLQFLGQLQSFQKYLLRFSVNFIAIKAIVYAKSPLGLICCNV